MGRISLELVPHDGKSFAEELKLAKRIFPAADTLNIPDILKYDMRIPEASDVAVKYYDKVIPHIRAVAVNRETPFSCRDFLERTGIDEVLVILGDNPEIVSKSENPCDSPELIAKIKREMPGIKVYAGIDQWRSPADEEMAYVRRKVDAGADGFFTQPFYEIEAMRMWSEKLKDTQVFWGVAPVIRESSRHYWETKNNIRFPDDFECTMEWNKRFAAEAIAFAEEDGSNVYLCPITVDIEAYLPGIVRPEGGGNDKG